MRNAERGARHRHGSPAQVAGLPCLRYARRAARSAAVLITSIALLAGCRGSGRSDLVEAELRTRNRELREAREELERATLVNQALEGELHGLRHAQPVARGGAAQPVGVRDVAVGRGTGGVDEDRVPGDEALLVVVTP